MATIEPINPLRLDVPKRKPRAVLSASSCFYDLSWLTNTDKFLETVARFAEMIADSHAMDSSLQQLIANAVISAFVITVAFI